MVIFELKHKIISELQSALKENASFEADCIIMDILRLSRTQYTISSRTPVPQADEQRIIEAVERRKSGEPLQYILKKAEFMSLPFFVNSSTLIPRSDTEVIVEKVLNIMNQKSVKLLDIGTGSGCIGISCGYYNQNAKITLLDISKQALDTAGKNAKENNVTVTLIQKDILSEALTDTYDMIVSNPPYIPTPVIDTLDTEVKDFEPHSALDGGKDGLLFYRRITELSLSSLSKNGWLIYEIGYDQGDSVKDLLLPYFHHVEVIKDLCGNDRMVLGQLK